MSRSPVVSRWRTAERCSSMRSETSRRRAGEAAPRASGTELRATRRYAIDRVDVRWSPPEPGPQQLIVDGGFRGPLLRLNVVPVTLPPLRSAPGHPLLVAHFLEKFNAGSKRITSEAMDALLRYQWPGNIASSRTPSSASSYSPRRRHHSRGTPEEVRTGIATSAPGSARSSCRRREWTSRSRARPREAGSRPLGIQRPKAAKLLG